MVDKEQRNSTNSQTKLKVRRKHHLLASKISTLHAVRQICSSFQDLPQPPSLLTKKKKKNQSPCTSKMSYPSSHLVNVYPKKKKKGTMLI